MFLQPGSSGADYFQYDSTNAVNWQIKGKAGSHLNLNICPVFLTVSHHQNPYGACYLDVKCNEIKATTQSAVKGSVLLSFLSSCIHIKLFQQCLNTRKFMNEAFSFHFICYHFSIEYL